MLIAIVGGIAAWYGVQALHAQPHAGHAGPVEINLAVLYASVVVGGVLLVVYAISMIVAPPPPTHAIGVH